MLRVLICDDDKSIVEKINKLLLKFEKENRIKFQTKSYISSTEILDKFESYDIAFIDIEMPDINGLQLAMELKRRNPDIIIMIITSYQGYLDKAMRIQVFSYLSKPIEKNRFFENLSAAVVSYKKICKVIIIEVNDHVYRVKTKDILYIENRKCGSIIKTKTEEFKTNNKPTEWMEIIDQPNIFVFSHKSFLVNLQNVIDFDRKDVTLRSGEHTTVTVYMSQRKYSNFKKAFYDFVGGSR